VTTQEPPLRSAQQQAATGRVNRAVFRQFAQDAGVVREQATELATLAAQSYADRMAQLGKQVGQSAPAAADLDPAVRRQLARTARDNAGDITLTFNSDLGQYIDGQLLADPALSQAELSRMVRNWAGERADWKAPQVATTQAAAARHAADRDFIRRNEVSVQVRVTPEDAECDSCQEAVDQGWMSAEDGAALDLPLHPSCVHELAYGKGLGDGGDLWLGGD